MLLNRREDSANLEKGLLLILFELEESRSSVVLRQAFDPVGEIGNDVCPSYSRRSSISCLRGFWDLGAHGFVRLFHRLTTDTFANALEG